MPENNEAFNTFEKGLDRDSSNQNKPNGTYEYGENLINNSEEGKYLLAPEAGIVNTNISTTETIIDEDPLHWITIGSVYIDDIEILFQGYASSIPAVFTDSRIGYKSLITGLFKVVYVNHTRLNFNIDYHINNPQAKKIYNGDINLYFTDNFNSPKFLRLVYQSDLSGDPYIVTQEVANLTLDFEEPLIDFTSQTETGGNAPIGSIHFFIQYLDRYGNTTRFSNLTNGIPVISGPRTAGQHTDVYTTNYAGSTSVGYQIPFGQLNASGYNSGVNSSKIIRITIDHLDTSYTYFKLGYMYYTDTTYTPTYKLITKLYTIPEDPALFIDDYIVDVTFNEPTTDLTADQVTEIAKKFEYTHAKCMAQHQNYLLMGNLRNKYEAVNDSIYEAICNNIDVRTAIKVLTTDTTTYNSSEFNQAFDHEQSSFRYKSYKRAEVYSLGLRFIYKGGYKTKVFHIPAKERVTEYNANILYNLPISGDNLTGTFYSSELYKVDSGYVNPSNNILNIRHHVMPDFYHDDGTANTYRLSTDNFFTANTTTVNALGLYFENIEINTLPESILADIVGIEFVRQTRENAQNKRILAQGISRAIQRPLSKSGNYPVVRDTSNIPQPFNAGVASKDHPFALQSKADLYVASDIQIDHTVSTPIDWNYDGVEDTYLRADGLSPYVSGQYGAIGKKIGEYGQMLNAVNSLTAPLDTFGHINKMVMPIDPPTIVYYPYTSYDEFILNIVSPDTEMGFVILPSTVKLELRDKLYFETYDVRDGNDSGGRKGSLIRINNGVGDLDFDPNELGRRSGGSNMYLRSLTNSSYRYQVGPPEYRTKIFQASYSNHTSTLVAKPNISKTIAGFDSIYLSPSLNSLLISDTTVHYPINQDIVDISTYGLTIHDNVIDFDNTYDFLIKHCYVNDGLYLIPTLETYNSLLPLLKSLTNCNLRFEVGYYNDGDYTVESHQEIVPSQATLTFPNVPFFKKIFRKDLISGNATGATITPYASLSAVEKLEVDYSSTPIFDIIQEIPNQYGSIYNGEYFPIQVTYDIDKVVPTDIGTYNNPLFSGDVFVSWYGSNSGGYGENYSRNNDSSNTNPTLFPDNELLHKISTFHNNLIYYPVETTINTHFRATANLNGVPYYPAHSTKESFENIPIEYRQAPHFNSDNYTLAYSYNQNNVNLSTAANQLTNNSGLGLFPNRIIYSNKSVDGEIDDSYRMFLTNIYTDIPKDTGEIWNMYQYSNDIYAHTPNALFKTFMLQTSMIKPNTGSEIVLGTSDLFGVPPQKILTKEGSSGGSKSAWGYMITPYGLLFIDNNGDKVYRLINDQLEEISFNGMMNFFKLYTKFLTTRGNYRDQTHYIDDTPYNPFNGHGWHFGYDDYNKRVLMTKRSGISNIDPKLSERSTGNIRRPELFFKEFTISYSFINNSFIGFSSYKPAYYINSGTHVISMPDPQTMNVSYNFIGEHKDWTNPCLFYQGAPEDSILKFTVNQYPQYEKVFDNIFIDMYNYTQLQEIPPFGIFDKALFYNRGTTVPNQYDTIEVETSNQYSGVRELHYNTGLADMFTYYLDKKLNVKYFLKQYRVPIPKSRTINQQIDKDSIFNYNNGNTSYNEVGDRMKDKFMQITLTWKNYERFSFIVNFIKSIFRLNRR